MKNFDSIALAAGWRQALQDAIDSQNADDLYDAIADNGFETKESYQHGRDVAWMTKYAKDILAGRVKVSASAIRQHQVALAAVRRELADGDDWDVSGDSTECKCGHTLSGHQQWGKLHPCTVCSCKQFKLP